MNVGGTARYVGELVENIPLSKLATGYVQSGEIEDNCLHKITILRIPHLGRRISPFNDFIAWIELRKIIKETKPAIVHTHTYKAGFIGRLISGKHRSVHTFHGHLFNDKSFSPIAKKFIAFAERFLANRTDLLISVGEKVGTELRAEGIGVNQDWQSIAPGVQALPSLAKSQARRALGLKVDVIYVGWMARMAQVKNPFLLLEIARQLPEVSFVMAGGGLLLKEIKESAPENVAVIGWTNAATFWSGMDCAISTSDNEGMPVALIEAQLAGVPVIATDVGSNSEVIENHKTGIITSKNALHLVEAVSNLVNNAPLRISMGIAASERAKREFSKEKMISAHNLAYSMLLL